MGTQQYVPDHQCMNTYSRASYQLSKIITPCTVSVMLTCFALKLLYHQYLALGARRHAIYT